jgi:hypothetical protein
LLLLGNTLGYLSWYIWWDLVKLWPILLIAIGIELIFKNSKMPAVSYLSPLLIVLCFIYVTFDGNVSANNYDDPELRTSTYIINESDAGDIKSLDISLDFSIGDYEFDVADTGIFYGEFEYYGSDPTFDFDQDGDEGEIKLKFKGFKHKFKNLRRKSCHSEVFITDKIPVNLDIDAGVVDMVLDFTKVRISTLDIDSGVSDLMIRLGDRSQHIDASFDTGVSDMIIYIPEGTALRLRKDTGIASVSYKELGLKKISKHLYETPGYETAERTIEIDIDAGIGDIDFEYYDSGRAEL